MDVGRLRNIPVFADVSNGTRLVIWDCLTRADQLWTLP